MNPIRIKRDYLVQGVSDEVAVLIPEKSWYYLRAMIEQRAGSKLLQQSLASVLLGIVISDAFFLASAFVQGYRSDLPEWVWPAAWIVGVVSAIGALILFTSVRISTKAGARSDEELLEFMDSLVSRPEPTSQKLRPASSGDTPKRGRSDGEEGDPKSRVPLAKAPSVKAKDTAIRIGDRVVHAQFGEGIVTNISETGVEVEFEFVGPKVLVPVQPNQSPDESLSTT